MNVRSEKGKVRKADTFKKVGEQKMYATKKNNFHPT